MREELSIDVSQPLLTPARVAEILGVSVATLATWRCTQRYPLPWVLVGRRVRYQAADVAAFINARRVQVASASGA
jgi:hypothetical protein